MWDRDLYLYFGMVSIPVPVPYNGSHFHQRRRTRIQIRIPNPIVTLYYAQLFPTGSDLDLDPRMDSFLNGYCMHFRDGSPSQGSEFESVSVGGNEPLVPSV